MRNVIIFVLLIITGNYWCFFNEALYLRFVKLLSAILAFYILLLAAIPCCAYDHCEDVTISSVMSTKAKQHLPERQKDTGCNSCSPFFSCHGCSGFIVAERLSNTLPAASFNIPLYNLYREPYYSQFVPFFWQPPDVV